MKLHHHAFAGCTPTPLANYLKALGIIRIVAEQFDPECRGWWENEQFQLLSILSRDELEQAFLEKYEPTPIFNPWGGRSGFYTGSSEKTTREALLQVEQLTNPNLSNFQSVIADVRKTIEQHGPGKPNKDQESVFIRRIRRHARGSSIDWLDTVVADVDNKVLKPPIFGTGGNEGSGSYTAAYYAAIVNCFATSDSLDQFQRSVWQERNLDKTTWDGEFQSVSDSAKLGMKKNCVDAPFRQFLPGSKGNYWDLILTFEGALVLKSGVVKKSNPIGEKFISSPYFFEPLGAGAASSSEYDEYAISQGVKTPGRGEQWFPIWIRKATYHEIAAIFRESRCAFGKKPAVKPLQAAFSLSSRGVAAGITGFVRYGYLQRNNQATHFAVPLGRVHVNQIEQKAFAVELVEWEDKLHRQARSKTTTEKLKIAHRTFASTLFNALLSYDDPSKWQAVLISGNEIELLQKLGAAYESGPIPPLRPEWLSAINDNSVELRLAVAMASAASEYDRQGYPVDSIRHHWLPLVPGRFPKFNKSEKKLAKDPRVVMTGRDLLGDCAAVVERRIIDAEKSAKRSLPLVPHRNCGASLEDIQQFLIGAVDDRKLFSLARALMAVQWNQVRKEHIRSLETPIQHRTGILPDDSWLMLRLVHLPRSLNGDRIVPVESSVTRLLRSGQSTRAIEIAKRRLQSVGIKSPVSFGYVDQTTAQRWAAALVFPLSQGSFQRAAEIIDPRIKVHTHV